MLTIRGSETFTQTPSLVPTIRRYIVQPDAPHFTFSIQSTQPLAVSTIEKIPTLSWQLGMSIGCSSGSANWVNRELRERRGPKGNKWKTFISDSGLWRRPYSQRIRAGTEEVLWAQWYKTQACYSSWRLVSGTIGDGHARSCTHGWKRRTIQAVQSSWSVSNYRAAKTWRALECECW